MITPTAVPPDHPENYLVKAKTIAKETPGAVLANQFYNPANPGRLELRLRRLLARAQLEEEEVNILRGFLKTLERPKIR